MREREREIFKMLPPGVGPEENERERQNERARERE